MSSQLAMSVMSVAEFGLWALLGFLFWKRKLYRRFPSMGAYLALRVASTPMLLAALYVQSRSWGRNYYAAYFFPYWAVYIASAVLLLLVCIEVFRSALSALPGLMKIGIVIFRWAILVSCGRQLLFDIDRASWPRGHSRHRGCSDALGEHP